ncbi:unnamed protein product [Blepharisma stoltei]|uniref:RING-type domain-containing protein n=1 Tax=Blepharisma stoltei TaxID=1481888 RepID=A0AAU9K365_9CILI|nr:unnamed protein product [Blepharisma stoltei]
MSTPQDLNEYEIDNYDHTTCPFEPNHRLQTPESFKYHITRCKNKDFNYIKPRIKVCKHNISHIFIDDAKLKYHEPRCTSHYSRSSYKLAANGQQTSALWTYRVCPYNPNHQIRDDEKIAWDRHLQFCPNRDSRYEAPPVPALDQTLSGKLNYAHGLVSTEEQFIPPPCTKIRKIEPFDNSRHLIVVHFIFKQFSVWKTNANPNQCFNEMDLWIDRTASADHREWPGLREIEQQRNHGEYLVATLYPNDSENSSKTIYRSFIQMLTGHVDGKPPCKLAVSTQSSSEQNLIYLIAHRTEDTGFGSAVTDSELGLFAVPHSLLYGKHDTLSAYQNKLKSHEEKISFLENQNRLLQEECEKLAQERNEFKIKCDGLVYEFENTVKVEFQQKLLDKDQEIQDLRTKTEALIRNLKTGYDKELQKLAEEIDRERREKEANRMNFEADLQNLKTQTKKQKETILEQSDKSRKEIDERGTKIIFLQRQLEEKNAIEKQMADTIERLNEQLYVQKKNFEENKAPDMKKYIEMQRVQEREIIVREYQDRELCVICMNEKKNTVFVPCGHLMYCNVCLNELGLSLDKKIPTNHPHGKCSLCETKLKMVHRAYPY